VFHIPTTAKWNPSSVNAALTEVGLSSRVEGSNIVIESPRRKPSHVLMALIQRIYVRRPYWLTLEYCPECFVFRVKVSSHPRFPFLDTIDRIVNVMRDHGYLQIYTDASVREIAISATKPNGELDAALEELDILETAPFSARDNEFARQRGELFMKIDRILFTALSARENIGQA
jgi:hypothetical protein